MSASGSELPVGSQDRDNFVRNLVTVLVGSTYIQIPWGSDGSGVTSSAPLSRSAAGRDAAVALDAIKDHLRIDKTQTVEDAYLTSFEMAARIHTENFLRRPIDTNVGENVKVAILLLIAHWYRNRETVVTGDRAAIEVPQAWKDLLSAERDYPGVY